RLAEDDEEERRLFHVALTRAKRRAVVTCGTRPSPFVAELTAPPPDHEVVRPGGPRPRVERAAPSGSRSARSSRSSGASDDPLADKSTVVPGVGMMLDDNGQQWTIEEVGPEGALARFGTATRRFPIGAKVVTVGRQRGSLQLDPGDPDGLAATAYEALRRWREVARSGKPAYVVFDDKTLVEIARTRPADTSELARVRGVGPAKLEQYGDAVIGLLGDL
ncbi:MAG: HRDC domain-containing protein, partial [Ilumatobacteraceae bacterium]